MEFEPGLRFWGQILGNTASPDRTTASGSYQFLEESKGLDDTIDRPSSSALVLGSVKPSLPYPCGCSAIYLEPVTKTKDFSNFTLEVLFVWILSFCLFVCFILLHDNILQGSPDWP